MASFLLGFKSGGNNLLSGSYFSGQGGLHPVGGIQLRADKSNSGAIYVAFSGGMTIGSGGLNLSGFANMSGAMDGSPIYAGDGYFVPKLIFNTPPGSSGFIGNSGNPGIFVNPDAACSGAARIYVEVF